MSTRQKRCEQCGEEFTPNYRVTEAYWKTRRFCSPACCAEGSRGTRLSTFGKAKRTPEERFWPKVKKGQDDECWLWVGALDGKGYGYLANTRRQGAKKAHRLSYELHFGQIPKGLCVCHRCDNPPCVNPNHLFIGTKADNSADMVRKGRGSDKNGEANPNAKLTYQDAVQIRLLRSSGMTQQAIADQFRVSQNAISRIVRNLLWTALQEPTRVSLEI